MGGHTKREGLTVGRSLSTAAIVRLRRAGVNGRAAATAVRLSVVDAVRREATQYASISRSLSSLMPK